MGLRIGNGTEPPELGHDHSTKRKLCLPFLDDLASLRAYACNLVRSSLFFLSHVLYTLYYLQWEISGLSGCLFITLRSLTKQSFQPWDFWVTIFRQSRTYIRINLKSCCCFFSSLSGGSTLQLAFPILPLSNILRKLSSENERLRAKSRYPNAKHIKTLRI